jgi:hypothetical protein
MRSVTLVWAWLFVVSCLVVATAIHAPSVGWVIPCACAWGVTFGVAWELRDEDL